MHKQSKEIYAMKVMKKIKIIARKSVSSVINERKILTLIRNPYFSLFKFYINDHFSLIFFSFIINIVVAF